MTDNRKSWLEWRAQGIGASDAPIIMGVSPWSTPHQLWEQKTKKVVKEYSNWATDRGNKLEPKARAMYEFETGLSFPAVLTANGEFPFIRASLDGYNAENGIILEIKCPGSEDHNKAVEGKIPEKYWPQVQHQLLACPKANCLHYYSFDGEKGVAIVVEREFEYQKELFEALCRFWKCVLEDVAPELTERDFKKVRSEELKKKLAKLADVKASLKLYEAEKEELEKQIYGHEDVIGRRVRVDNWKINICHRRGSVDYNQIEALRGLDLEPFRKKGTSYRVITEEK